MNYLITGGTGLIGQRVIEKLSQKNVKLTVLTRDKIKAKKQCCDKVRLIEHLSLNEIENSNIVINLAGEPIANNRWSKAMKEKICRSRWLLTQQIVSLIEQAKAPPHLFISGSAIGIYGRQSKEEIDENFTDFHHEFTHKVCQKWEDIAMSAMTKNTRVALLRTGIVLAKDSGALAKMILPFKLGLGGKIATGKQFMSWIHIEDMVNAIIHIIDNNELNGPINMTSENAVSNQKFTAALAKILNRPAFLSTPAVLLELLFGEMSELLVYGQNVYPKKLKTSKFTFTYTNIDTALEDLLSS
ncbi:MAG: TIGR01777 family oxidoreductase [Litorilituus sp.]|nr:TIGR01777 family oxidoreductase [Litorilituus sp.]